MKKRIGILILAAAVLCALLCTTAFASSADTAAQALSTVGIFRGTASGFDLAREPTRAEAAVMLVRLLGKEQTAADAFAAGTLTQPFTDAAGWAESSIAWLYTNGLTRGSSQQTFGGGRTCTAKDYAVFLLRALGYRDGTDFTYDTAEAFAAETGIYSDSLFGGTFTRGDLALMSERALAAAVRGGDKSLLDTLIAEGAVDAAAAADLQQTLKTGQRLHISQEGVTLDESAWNSACDTLALTVQLAGSPDVQTVPADTLKTLMVSDGQGHVRVDEQALSALIAGWGQTWNRYNVPYQFKSYKKGPISIDFLRCDYRVDEQATAKALRQQLYGLESGAVSACLACYDKQGKPFSIEASHVEVDIDNQQLTMVKNGNVVITTPIVTGALGGHQTPTGLYWAHHMQTNITLSGADYSVFVKYWVSVIGDSIGLHDASWRYSFGGTNYVYGGSHGCVNIPESSMAKIYASIYEGMPVLIHGRNSVGR